MRHPSHNAHTFIGHLRDAVESWRKHNRWSRETVVQAIVEVHERIDGPAATGIEFDPPTRDAFERGKVNADRVFRWLDDVTKDTNTCPANFIPSILEALPLDLRVALTNQWLMPHGLTCRPQNSGSVQDNALELFRALIKESAEAQTSFANLLDGSDRFELDSAHTELCEALAAIGNALAMIERRRGEIAA